MAVRKPLVIGGTGNTQQLQSGDGLAIALVSSTFGVTYATLDDRLDAIESALLFDGIGPTVGLAGRAYVFTNPINSAYVATF